MWLLIDTYEIHNTQYTHGPYELLIGIIRKSNWDSSSLRVGKYKFFKVWSFRTAIDEIFYKNKWFYVFFICLSGKSCEKGKFTWSRFKIITELTRAYI